MLRRMMLVTAGAVLTASTSSVWATSFMDINFDADTVGNAPTTAAPGSPPITVPYAIGGYDPNYASPPSAASGTILVNNVPGMSKAAVFTTNPANSELGALWLDTGFNVASQQLTLSFDLNILAAPTTATAQPKTVNGGPGTAGILLGMNTYTSNGWAARFAAAPTSANGGIFAIRSPSNTDLQSFFNYTEGQTYHIQLVLDYDTGIVQTMVDNVATGDFAFWNVGASNVSTSEFFFHLNGESQSANSIALDNINLFAGVPVPAPEPISAGLGLMSLAGLASYLTGRRARA